MKSQVVPLKTKLNALERVDKGGLVKKCCPVIIHLGKTTIKEWNKILMSYILHSDCFQCLTKNENGRECMMVVIYERKKGNF